LRENDTICFNVIRNGQNITIGNLETSVILSSDLVRCDTTADYINK